MGQLSVIGIPNGRRYKRLAAGILLLVLAAWPALAQQGSPPISLGNYPQYGSEARVQDMSASQHQATLAHFYSARNYRLAWFGRWGKLPLADSMLLLIGQVPGQGLNPADYHQAALLGLFAQINGHQATSAQIERADYLLSDAFFTLGWHLQKGRFIPHKGQRHLQRLPENRDMAAALERGLQQNGLRLQLYEMEPLHPQYRLLKAALQQKLLRLQQLQEGTPATPAAELQAVEQQIRLLGANLERWRWEAPNLPPTYLMVNLPAYQLQVVEEGEAMFSSRVIIGKPSTPSPVLESRIDCIVIYPYWTVPRSIALGEILPKLKKDPAYLRRNGFEVLDQKGQVLVQQDLDWKAYNASNFPYTFRQREGLDNALGLVKFSFDNPFSVYLHDTNARSLFGSSRQALSHGCIRVERALELAHLLLSTDSLYNQPGLLDSYFARQLKKEIMLKTPMPLYIRYFTAWWEADSLQFFPDIYQKDAALLTPSPAPVLQ